MPAPIDSVAHKIARYVLIATLLLLGGWMLRRFLPALCWAAVLAVASSALYERWLRRFTGRRRHLWAALTFTIALGVIVVAPLVYGGFVAVREASALLRTFTETARNGAPDLPQWLAQLPGIGGWLHNEWVQRLGGSGAASAVARARPTVMHWSGEIGLQLFRRIVTLGFTLLTFFFVCLYRERLSRDVPHAAQRLFGPNVLPLLAGVVNAIRATVDGIVLVAVAEGAILGGVYALVGAPHPILLGAVTGVFAMIPFAAPIAFGVVALILAANGALGGAIAVLVAGLILLFLSDHFVRPMIIGEGARLPFLWVLLGILGGIESFGLVGLFLGPALMAVLVAVWRSWVEQTAADGGSP